MNTQAVTLKLDHQADFDTWRILARRCLHARIDPSRCLWQPPDGQEDLFRDDEVDADVLDIACLTRDRSAMDYRVPERFISLAKQVVCHRGQHRFALLYRVLFRLANGERSLMSSVSDEDVQQLFSMARQVRRDQHKMKAFVRFDRQIVNGMEHYRAFFTPDHHILRSTAGFFCRRFANMQWSISTPEESAHWDGKAVLFGPPLCHSVECDDADSVDSSLKLSASGAAANTATAGDTAAADATHAAPADANDADSAEDLWLTYYANIFNPARLKTQAMRAEMPVKYWKGLPESALIAQLTHGSSGRTESMITKAPTEPPRYASKAVADVLSETLATAVSAEPELFMKPPDSSASPFPVANPAQSEIQSVFRSFAESATEKGSGERIRHFMNSSGLA